MHKTLIIQAFNKAGTLRKKQGEKAPSLSHIAEDLAVFVEDKEDFGLGERSYRDYYGDAKKLINKNEDISIKQLKVINGLSKYLGYSNYEDFAKSLNNKSFISTLGTFFRKNKVILIILFLLLVSLIAYYSINKQRWMVWEENHYIEVKFDPKKYSIGRLKLYDSDKIKNLKKIDADCETEIINANGEILIWYGKNIQKKLEYFTALGLHPETGKTLNPMTNYMKRTHLCKEH